MKSFIKKIKIKINKLTGFWCAKDHLSALQNYRLYELKVALKKLKLNYDKKYNILDFDMVMASKQIILKIKNLMFQQLK